MNHRFNRIVFLIALLLASASRAEVVEDEFVALPDGTKIARWTISNAGGASVSIISYGGIVTSLKVPDRDGKLDDIVLGHEKIDGYLTKSPYFGCIVGRYANRIGGAKFTLDGQEFPITKNDGPNVLHGGKRGFNSVVWTGTKVDGQTVELKYLSKDGEEGFPGTLHATVRYSLSDAGVLKIEYSATTDKPTVVNLTNHSYFNLAGQGNGDVLKHELTIDAEQFTPTNDKLIPTGEFAPVAGTKYDFRQPHGIGERIGAADDKSRGYDMNFVLTKNEGLRHAATVTEPTAGRVMEVWTTEPGIQLYTGNGLNGSIIGKGKKAYPQFGAFCLETQHFPDSPNQPAFPSVVLKPGETYHTTTEYRFGTAKK